MWILRLYLARNVFLGFVVTALIIVGLFSIVLLIEELDDVGTGGYDLTMSLRYVLLHMPMVLNDFAAVISLIGAVVVLGALAGKHELIAIQSLGGTPRNIVTSVLMAAALIMSLMLLSAEFLVPKTLQQAQMEKALATADQGDFVSKSGYWAQSDGQYIHIKQIEDGRTPYDIELFEFTADYRLRRYLTASYADIQSQEQWLLHDVSEKTLVGERMQQKNHDTLQWQSFLSAEQLGVIISNPQALSITDLNQFVQGLKQRGEKSYPFEVLFWQKLMSPLAAGIMIVLGLSFVFGSQRQVSTGQRITIGVLTGIGFYVFSQMINHLGFALGWQPLLVAGSPNAIAIIALLLLAYLRQAKA